jgi:hypothetical protein
MDDHLDRNLILSVSPGENSQWHVKAQDLAQPLASFGSPHAACDWAIAYAKPQGGKVLIEELMSSNQSSAGEDMNAPHIFKYSIPVRY